MPAHHPLLGEIQLVDLTMRSRIGQTAWQRPQRPSKGRQSNRERLDVHHVTSLDRTKARTRRRATGFGSVGSEPNLV